MLPGEVTRSIYRRADIEQALASFAYTVTVTGGQVSVDDTLRHLCLAFGIRLEDVVRRVREVTGK